MAIIIAASLQLHSQAEEAIEQLISAGFAPEKVTYFFVNPPGQHDLYPIGGDEAESPGAEMFKNAAIESAIVGAIETLIGVTHEKEDEAAAAAKHAKTASPHRAGMLVAVELADPSDQERTVALFARLGASNIEKAEGKIVNGEWLDFNPLIESSYL